MIRSFTIVTAATLAVSSPAFAQADHSQHEHEMTQGAERQQHDGMQHGPQHQQEGEPITVGGEGVAMPGLFGHYPSARDASGTAWQPDTSPGMHHLMNDTWEVMSHLQLNGVYAWSDGLRGDDKAFVSGMAMISAYGYFDNGWTANLRGMFAPDPFMGASGYPLLFAAGETANGVDPLVDRQHPHDLVMELSASLTRQIDFDNHVFAYVGLPGEPAFGPPAFMHRTSAMDSPEAPITHHWFDSTHITFGVATLGYVHDDWKFEVSRFRGREPDEDRYDIETGDLDSTSARVSWNPTERLALQASWAEIESPEGLEPDEDETRWSVSGIYTGRFGDDNSAWWSATLAYSSKERSDGVSLGAWLGEWAVHPNDRWTVFARGEGIETDELGAVHHGPVEDVQRVSLGAIRDFRLNHHVVFGVGALVQQHFASAALEPLYDGDPPGAMAFVRLKVG
jgi:hypothetical protein